MRISKLSIQNYRSIKDLTLEPGKLCALVGPNGVGKSNVLKAIDIVLGERYPTKRVFSKDDFYDRNFNEYIRIQIEFSEPLDECRLTNYETRQKENCKPTKLMFSHTENENVSDFEKTQFLAFDSDGNKYWAAGVARDQVSFVYIPSERKLEKQMTVSQWTLLGKILKKVDENFRSKNNKNEISQKEKKFRTAMEKPRKILESKIEGKLSYHDFKEKFTSICKKSAEGLSNKFDLDLEIYDPLFYYKTIQIIGEDEFNRSFNVQELGSGIQNLVLLSLFRTYGKLLKESIILAIEEPEMYLYPQAQRALYSNLIELTYPKEREGNQVFYTTHNPNFVDAQRANEIEMLFKDDNEGTYCLEKSDLIARSFLQESRFKIFTHFNTERNELFFAKKVLLVEGDADKILFTTLCEEKWHIDLDKGGIAIIECGGKGGVIYFIGVCRLMGMNNFFAVWDSDEEVTDQYDNLRHALDTNAGLEISGNMEDFLGLPGGSSARKVKNAYEWAQKIEENNIPEGFNEIKEFLTNEKPLNETVEEGDWQESNDNIPF